MRAGAVVTTFVLLLAAPGALPAQGPAGWFQVHGFYHSVSDDFGDWKGFGAQLVAPAGPRDLWYAEAFVREAFDDRGGYASLAQRHQFSPRVFTLVGLGAGTGDFIHPDLRGDATLGIAWLPRGNLVTQAGVTYVNAKLGYEDVTIRGSLVLYLPGAALEAGASSNWSWPDAIQSTRGFAAFTLGRDRLRVLTLRGSAGWEGYQLLGAESIERRFRSYEGSLALRQWLGGKMGLLVQAEWYDNPFYTRAGGTLGVFRHW